jgi:hypothetical protein
MRGVIRNTIISSTASIHGGRMAKALACNARGDEFAHHLRLYLNELFIDLTCFAVGLCQRLYLVKYYLVTKI